jgi:hypothetical protein
VTALRHRHRGASHLLMVEHVNGTLQLGPVGKGHCSKPVEVGTPCKALGAPATGWRHQRHSAFSLLQLCVMCRCVGCSWGLPISGHLRPCFLRSCFLDSICRLLPFPSCTGSSLITAVPLEKLAHRSSDGDCTAQSSPYRCEGPSEEGDAQREPAAGADGDWQVARTNVTTCARCSPSVGYLLRTACGDTGVSCRPMITCTAKWLGETRKVLRK